MTEQEFAAGHVFFHSGDTGDRAYLLHEGQVELLAGADEALARVGLFQPGDVFGEMALIEERPRALTARAVTASRATPMTRDEFEHYLTHDPARTRQYLRSLFERLRSQTGGLASEVELVQEGPPTPLVPAQVELPHGPGKPAGWALVVHPLTRKAAQTLPDEGLLVTRFPLRIGRVTGAYEPEALDLNDLWLLDDKPYHVSRNHCEIHIDRKGPVVRDRGSHLGCIVNDKQIGGRLWRSQARLSAGDNVLVIGAWTSPYQFRLTVSPA